MQNIVVLILTMNDLRRRRTKVMFSHVSVCLSSKLLTTDKWILLKLCGRDRRGHGQMAIQMARSRPRSGSQSRSMIFFKQQIVSSQFDRHQSRRRYMSAPVILVVTVIVFQRRRGLRIRNFATNTVEAPQIQFCEAPLSVFNI